MAQKIEVGISSLLPQDYSSREILPRYSELDLVSYLSWSKQEKKHLLRRLHSGHRLVGSCTSSWVFSDEMAVSERIQILAELREELKWETLLVRLQSKHFDSAGMTFDYPVHFDLSRTARAQIKTELSPIVWDPMWETRIKMAQSSRSAMALFKIHGWHQERWMRKYGSEQIRDCVRRIRLKLAPKQRGIVLLGHSQRREQWRDFQGALASAGVTNACTS